MLPKVAQKIAANATAKAALKTGTGEVRFYAFADTPAKPLLPYATWQLTTGSPDEYLSCIPDGDEYDFQVDVWHSSTSAVTAIATTIRDALEPFYRLTYFTGSERDFETGLFRFIMRFNGREDRDQPVKAGGFYKKNDVWFYAPTTTSLLSDALAAWDSFSYSSNPNALVPVTDEFGVTKSITANQFDISLLTSLSFILYNRQIFNQDISNWDLSNISNTSSMLKNAQNFTQDISGWNVSNVTIMNEMLSGASKFNQDLSGWCVSKIPSKPTGFDSFAGAWVLPRPIWGTCP